ncbi:response regulator [Desulfohalovibrio reitneri]|uniref:response regulator n=1 Tax=Desulfohalovibrio reitneri TaxID=1307759 RepID=UPI00068F0DAB|nr:response regulator [Desulfohalovibrio reitneri]
MAERAADTSREGRFQVLVVDDEPEFRETLAERIRLRGMEPLPAPDGATALELARSHPVSLAIVDYQMPDMDGLVVITKLREIDPGIRTVLLTGRGDEKARQASDALESKYFEKDDMQDFWRFLKRFGEGGGWSFSPRPRARAGIRSVWSWPRPPGRALAARGTRLRPGCWARPGPCRSCGA